MRTQLMIILWIPMLCFGQKDTTYQHEIGINIGTLFPIVQKDKKIAKVELSYVNHFSPKWSLRNKASINWSDSYYVNRSTRYFFVDTVVTSDTTLIRREYNQDQQNAIRLYSSVEYGLKEGPIQAYGGVGIVNGLVRNRVSRVDIYFEKLIVDDTLNYPYNFHHEQNRELIQGETFYSYMIGLFPYIGAKIPLGKRLWINIQLMMEWNFHFTYLRPHDLDQKIQYFHDRYEVFPATGEIGLYWRF